MSLLAQKRERIQISASAMDPLEADLTKENNLSLKASISSLRQWPLPPILLKTSLFNSNLVRKILSSGFSNNHYFQALKTSATAEVKMRVHCNQINSNLFWTNRVLVHNRELDPIDSQLI